MAHASASVVASWNTADNSTAPTGVRYGSNVVMGLPYGEPAGVSVKRQPSEPGRGEQEIAVAAAFDRHPDREAEDVRGGSR